MMAGIKQAVIVISTAGREKGKPFLVYAEDQNFVFLVDGRYRKLEKPKCKNKKHVSFLCESDSRIHAQLQDGTLTDSEIRKCLAAVKVEMLQV